MQVGWLYFVGQCGGFVECWLVEFVWYVVFVYCDFDFYVWIVDIVEYFDDMVEWL